jgi:hypothetical protein
MSDEATTRPRKAVSGVILLVALIASVSAAHHSTPGNDRATASDLAEDTATVATKSYTERGLSMTYPATWESTPATAPMVLTVNTLHGAMNMSLSRGELGTRSDESTQLKAFSDRDVAQIDSAFAPVGHLADSTMTLNGHPARRVLIARAQGKSAVRQLLFYMVSGSEIFLLVGTTEAVRFAALEPIFDASAHSLRRQ